MRQRVCWWWSRRDLFGRHVGREVEQLSEHAWAYTAEGDPNTGIIIGDDAVLVADTQATPAMAQDVIRRIREVTDKPIQYVLLSHYHAVRVLGASAYGAEHIIASEDTRDLIVERGEQDKASEIGRFPRLFQNLETVPAGLTWPTMTFTGKMTLWLGKLEIQLLQLGRGHTKGDTVVWLPQERAMLSGDLVEFDATPYAGDAYFQDWPQTLNNIAALNPLALVPDFWTCNARLWRDKLGQISLSTTTLFWGVSGNLRYIILAWSAAALGYGTTQASALTGVVALGTAIGAVAGLVNGLLVTRLHLPDFIASLTRLRDADADFLLPSHGPPFRHDKQLIQATIDCLTGYQYMADFGTCAVSWPLLDEWEKDVSEGRMPDFNGERPA